MSVHRKRLLLRSASETVIHRLLGSIVRYAPNAVIFDDPNFLPLVFHRKADKTEFNAPNLGFVNTFFAKYHHDHVAFKKRISHAVRLTRRVTD